MHISMTSRLPVATMQADSRLSLRRGARFGWVELLALEAAGVRQRPGLRPPWAKVTPASSRPTM
jgi:hypothetical protein